MPPIICVAAAGGYRRAVHGFETDPRPWAWAAAAIAATVVVVALGYRVLRRVVQRNPTLRAGFGQAHRPLQAVAVTTVVRAAIPPLLGDWERRAMEVLTALLVAFIAWLVAAVVLRIEDIALRRYRIDVADNLAARRIHTQISVVRRVTVAAITVLGAGAVLTTFPQARAAGASVLASAGLVGLVAALAAQSTLGNLFAGLNLAFGNALRLDDVVVVEGEWGRVEQITLSYVVVRIWDDRRLILPSSYFTTTPFQNWTRASAAVIGTRGDRRRLDRADRGDAGGGSPGRRGQRTVGPPRVRAADHPGHRRAGARPDHGQRRRQPGALGPALPGTRAAGHVAAARAPIRAAQAAGRTARRTRGARRVTAEAPRLIGGGQPRSNRYGPYVPAANTDRPSGAQHTARSGPATRIVAIFTPVTESHNRIV
jgi:hypothetical protein